MRKEPAVRLLHLARLFAAEPGGLCLDEIAAKLQVSRRTAERMRDAIAGVFPQLEEIDGERPKRWRLPIGLSGTFREPLADELRRLARRRTAAGARWAAPPLRRRLVRGFPASSFFCRSRKYPPPGPDRHQVDHLEIFGLNLDHHRSNFSIRR
jgi:predicted DNA-binding transcriptional regulator YafY